MNMSMMTVVFALRINYKQNKQLFKFTVITVFTQPVSRSGSSRRAELTLSLAPSAKEKSPILASGASKKSQRFQKALKMIVRFSCDCRLSSKHKIYPILKIFNQSQSKFSRASFQLFTS